MKKLLIVIISGVVLFITGTTGEPKNIMLPEPHRTGGKPLMEALNQRHTDRNFSQKPLPLQLISDLLWAANGINRTESGKRTAPSAMNNQEIDIYVSLKDGLYKYIAKNHSLELVVGEDIREFCGKQEFVKLAPVNLIYVADYSKMSKMSSEDMILYSSADAGFIAQNVYLFCASENLATVIRGSVDRKNLSSVMKLAANQKIVLSQTIGYPE